MLHAVFVFTVTCLVDVGLTLCTSDVVTFGQNDVKGHVTVPVPDEYADGLIFNVSVKLSLLEPYQGVDLDLAESLEVTKAKLQRRQPLKFVLAFPGSVPDVTEVKVNENVICTSQLSTAPYNRLRGRSARSTLEVSKAVVPTENNVQTVDNDNIVFPGMTNKLSSRNFGLRQNFRQSFNKCPWSSDREENDCSDLFWVDSTGTGALRVPVPSQRNPDSAVHSTAFFVAAGSLTEQDVRTAGLQLDEPLSFVLSRLRAGANDIRYTVQLPARAPCVQLVSLLVNGRQVCNKKDAVPRSSYTNFSLWHQVYHSTPVNQPPLPSQPPSRVPIQRPVSLPPVTPPPQAQPSLTPEPIEEETKPLHVQLHLVFRSPQALQVWLTQVFGVDLNLAGHQSSNLVRVLKLNSGKV